MHKYMHTTRSKNRVLSIGYPEMEISFSTGTWSKPKNKHNANKAGVDWVISYRHVLLYFFLVIALNHFEDPTNRVRVRVNTATLGNISHWRLLA